MTNTKTFEPTETWIPNSEGFELGEAIEQARRSISEKDPAQLIHELRQHVERSDNGIVYAVLKGEQPEIYSDSDALVMFNPFANTATPNMLVRAEFIREVAKQADVRDDNGRLKPVIMLASPGIFGSRLHLTKNDKSEIRKGNLGPVAKELLGTVSALEYGRVALLGFSQGSDIALSGAKKAYAANLDANKLSIGDPAGVMQRRPYEIAVDFFNSGGQFQESIDEGNIDAQKKAIGKSPFSLARNRDFIRFGGVSLTPSNRALWSALGKNSFEANMQEVLNEGRLDKIVIGYGELSDIAKPVALEPTLAQLHNQVADNRLISIRVENKNHSWGDQLPLLAKLYLKALI
jgi:hypothetical protein